MEITLNNPVITKMAMHVVGDTPGNNARHLPETPVVHQGFFISRINETAKGCKCVFQALSPVLTGLKKVRSGEKTFVEVSKILADSFHVAINSNGSTVSGAFLLFEINNNGETIYSIIKYEHDDVVHYEEKTEGGRSSLVFKLLATTFVKKPQAMQKSALIKFEGDQSVIYVIDRSERKGITTYFANYLGVVREYDEAEATGRLVRAVEAFVGKAISSGLLPADVKKTYRSRLFEFSQAKDASFDPEKVPEFLAAVVGNGGDDVKILFEKELEKQKIQGERFEMDKASVKRPSKLRTRTNDGIEINFSQSHIDTKKYVKKGDIITIDISTGLEEDASQMD